MTTETNADAEIRTAMIRATMPMFRVDGDRSSALYAWKNGTAVDFTIEHEPDPDPYQLLSYYQTAVAKNPQDRPDGIVLVTRGWATPMGEDGEPQPEGRIRCVVYCATTVTGTGSIVSMFPGSGDTIDPTLAQQVDQTDDSMGSGGGGPLAEAIDMVGVTLFGYQYAARLFAHAIEHHDTKQGEHLQRRAELAARGAAIAQHLLIEEGGDDVAGED